MPRKKELIKPQDLDGKNPLDLVAPHITAKVGSGKSFGLTPVEPGDNSRFLAEALVAWDMPPIDLRDIEQVKARIQQYWDFCVQNDKKPNIVGVANWLQVSRMTLNNWRRGVFRTEDHAELIGRVVNMLEELWADYMMNGKLNPACGIFLGKNWYGYKDVQDVVIAPNNPLGEEIDEAALQKRIAEHIVDEEDFED